MSAEPTEAPDELLLSVPHSSFDLLEGAAADRDRSRILNAAVFVILVAIVGTLASRGIVTRLDASDERDEAARLTEHAQEITNELQARRRSGEVSKPALDAHVGERLELIESIAGKELAYARMIREITALGPGITVDRITFGGGSAPSEAGSAQQSTAGAQDGEPAKKEDDSSITVSGTASDAGTANTATSALSDPAKFPYLSTGAPGSVNCNSGQGCSWTWNGTITDEGRADRASALRERITGSAGGGR